MILHCKIYIVTQINISFHIFAISWIYTSGFFLKVISYTLFAINNDLKLNNQYSISHANAVKNINHASKIGAFDIVSDDCYARVIWWHWRKLLIDFFHHDRSHLQSDDLIHSMTQKRIQWYLNVGNPKWWFHLFSENTIGPIYYLYKYIHITSIWGTLILAGLPNVLTLEITRIKRLLY